MQIDAEGFFHLTYCTNIHPSNGWPQAWRNLRHYGPALKARFSPDQPFGIGMRISGLESTQLLESDNLQQLRYFLDTNGLYVFTLNGFPYGPFHNQPVKENVHAPDWLHEERVQYTQRLITILAALLPDGVEGSISTSPLSYKRWVNPRDDNVWDQFTHNVIRVVEFMVRVYEGHGKLIHLDIEPEPDGVLENSREMAAFFRDWLLVRGAQALAQSLNISVPEAEKHICRHLRVCFDTCHVAVAYEEPIEVLDRFRAVGLQVGKVQVSSALKVLLPPDRAERELLGNELRPFAESTYLHQVVQRNSDGTLCQYPDLSDALHHFRDLQAAEWRIHFHVPIFVEHYGTFSSTQDGILKTFDTLHKEKYCQHLEIETYTWDVLPAGLKKDLLESISREFEWVLNVFDK
jgi:hypothetical protein